MSKQLRNDIGIPNIFVLALLAFGVAACGETSPIKLQPLGLTCAEVGCQLASDCAFEPTCWSEREDDQEMAPDQAVCSGQRCYYYWACSRDVEFEYGATRTTITDGIDPISGNALTAPGEVCLSWTLID